MQRAPRTQPGFTLVEMAMVLIVIGLITGGITMLLSMLDDAKVTAVVSEARNTISICKLFQEKYGAYPGDYANASTRIDAAATDPPMATASNGAIDANAEEWLAWQHLRLARMFAGGQLTGAANGVGGTTIGENVPAFSIEAAGLVLYYVAPDNRLRIARRDPAVTMDVPSVTLDQGFLSPLLSERVDRKLDDGVPGTGNVIGVDGAAGTCIVGGLYSNTSEAPGCYLEFILGQWTP